MPTTYQVTFHAGRTASVDITVPDGAPAIDHLANEIARELDLMRFEIQIGTEGGCIRRVGDDGPGIAFSIALIDQKDS